MVGIQVSLSCVYWILNRLLYPLSENHSCNYHIEQDTLI
nr:MAG TPA: hypothetical protein [Caudoviricetes sp.]